MALDRQQSLEHLVDILKSVAEPTRLRILALLRQGDLTVSDLTDILGQSQPRVSRHLKLLLESGAIERYQEGAWAYFRLCDNESRRSFLAEIVERLSPRDPQVERDNERLTTVKTRRRQKASDYFRANAAGWDELRTLHVSDEAVEQALRDVVGTRSFQAMLDLGTGTGRLLELFAPLYRRGVGIDQSREMLAIARANLEAAGIAHAQVRQGDVLAPPVERDAFDLVTLHQVLHYLDDPETAVREAARHLRPGGKLVIVDFASHDLEFLREEHAHLRLGFSDKQIMEWLEAAGLEIGEIRNFQPQNADGRLTVKFWVGLDQRMLIADTEAALASGLRETV
ncbi:ArsR/SmtB family transcription factor [Limoniibacter endophyticus]|uniref:ArsR family transcriptional regulator n=1 Tax=Limoniibacter endophyticus TaxID=1565040 RepID=A0A8J3DPV7_9HYPH|nr:metalloregulator ArsR/SmtB family transcription factor [Limoniibacter endophyticus]GHC75092.1 ArsR family transcriptional regulator [Limoniibacter endophyticus]